MNNKSKMSLACLQMANALIDMSKELNTDQSVDELCSNTEIAMKTLQSLEETTDNLTMAMANIRLEMLLKINASSFKNPRQGEGPAQREGVLDDGYSD